MTMTTSLRVLSYNIHKGFSLGNRRFVLDQIRHGIRQVQPDIVCLQEVAGENQEHRKRVENYPLNSQFEFLADELWPHFAYGKNAVYEGGHHGNAILSRYPILSSRNLDLSTNSLESRGLLHAIIEVPASTPTHVLTSHLNLLGPSRDKQLHWICEYIEKEINPKEKLVFCGDFNDWRKKLSAPLERRLGLREIFQECHGAYAKTFPSFLPLLCLDRIYFRNLDPQEAWTLTGDTWSKLSDHLGIAGQLSWS